MRWRLETIGAAAVGAGHAAGGGADALAGPMHGAAGALPARRVEADAAWAEPYPM